MVGDTSWAPPLPLYPGQNEFAVFYASADSSLVTALMVTSGSILWGNSSFAPTAPPFGPWPAMTPLLALVSLAEIQFTTVPMVEDFEAYSLQTDTTGSSGDFLVTTTGNLADPVVACVADALAAAAGIADLGSNQVWTLGSMSGPTGTSGSTDGFVLIGDLPGFGASTTGVFADFFASPRELFSVRIRAKVRESPNGVPMQFRFLIGDDMGNESVSELMPLTTSFQTFEAQAFDFFDLDVEQTDLGKIVGIGMEFFTDPAQPGMPLAVGFQVDDVEILPEPSHALLTLTALAALAALRRRR